MRTLRRATLYLPAAHRRLKALAVRDHRPAAELIREAIAEYVKRRGLRTLPSSIGAGHSRRGDLSKNGEKLLAGMGRG